MSSTVEKIFQIAWEIYCYVQISPIKVEKPVEKPVPIIRRNSLATIIHG